LLKPRFLQEWGKRGAGIGEFDIPIGMAINARDEIFVTEFRNNRVQQFDSHGRFLAALPVDPMPGGIAVAPSGNIYVAHMMLHKIGVYDRNGGRLFEWGKQGKGDGEFDQPGGMAISPSGSIYVADQVNRRMQQFDLHGKFIRKWGEYGVAPGQFGGNEKPANRTGGPQFATVDKAGNIYTTEGSVGRIQKFTPEGKYMLSWGNNSTEPGGFGGREKNLPGPIALCCDLKGRIWVSSTGHRVQCFSSSGQFLGGIDKHGSGPGEFTTPHALVVDSRNCLYVCDTQNARIQKFELD
jgi:sugar lactone lactonase YvrE